MKIDNNKVIDSRGSDKANETVANLFNKLKNNKSKKLIHMPNIKAKKKPIFLIPNAKKVFKR